MLEQLQSPASPLGAIILSAGGDEILNPPSSWEGTVHQHARERCDLCSVLQSAFLQRSSVTAKRNAVKGGNLEEQLLDGAWSSTAGDSVNGEAGCKSLRGQTKPSLPEFGISTVLASCCAPQRH